MGPARKTDLDRRLDTYFATLRSSPLREALKRSLGNWQVYAAVTGSAMAMVTGAAASTLGTSIRNVAVEPIAIASALAARQRASSRSTSLARNVRLAMAKQDARRGIRGVAAEVRSASQTQAPSIPPNGVVPFYGTVSVIEPGEWVTIYGSNLASGTALWNGDFPTSLGGTSVTINGRAAYLQYVSPGQVNLQAPDDTATGTVAVVVTTAAGKATSTVTLSPFSPSFNLRGANIASGIIHRAKGKGAYGGGSYDIIGPTGSSLGYPTTAARAGDSIELYGVGFGPTTPAIPAGKAFTGAAPLHTVLGLYINNVQVKTTFAGISAAGVYQINFIIPKGLGEGDVPIRAVVGGMQTQAGVLFSLEKGSGGGGPVVVTSGGGSNPGTSFNYGTGGGTYGGTYGGNNGGTYGGNNGGGGGTNGGGGGTNGGGGTDGGGGDSGGGSGGGSSVLMAAHGKKPYQPRLKFEQA